MLKRLWFILGPLFIAVIMIILTMIIIPDKKKYSLKEEKIFSVALSDTSFKNGVIKREILMNTKKNFVPFFGSSEWSRIDSMHPSVLAEKYERPYIPYLLGKRGTSSLTHFLIMQQISNQMIEKKAIFVISPQWFTKQGLKQNNLKKYISNTQLIAFLKKSSFSLYDREAAKRLLDIEPNLTMSYLLEKVSQGDNLSEWDMNYLNIMEYIGTKSEILFGQIGNINNYEDKILPKLEKLPAEFSYKDLYEKATKFGKKGTSNNPFDISNEFYNKNIAYQINELKNFQISYDYTSSPEYNDFQLVLSQFAKTNTDVLFVITPVNSKWSNYTGLNEEKYQLAVSKIKYQLESQGFTKIADFSQDGDKPYFMHDTIHIGWNGWLAFDEVVNPFLTSPYNLVNYNLNPYFLTKEWSNEINLFKTDIVE